MRIISDCFLFTFLVMFRFQADEVPILFGGPLGTNIFSFDNLHFHWGSNDKDGCEHIVDDQG